MSPAEGSLQNETEERNDKVRELQQRLRGLHLEGIDVEIREVLQRLDQEFSFLYDEPDSWLHEGRFYIRKHTCSREKEFMPDSDS